MTNRTSSILIAILAISIGCVIGFKVGIQFEKKRVDNTLSQIHFNGLATKLRSYVKVLELLRKNNVELGIELLEKLTDVELASLSMYKEIPVNERNVDIIATIMAAKEYRKQYPNHKVPSKLSIDVQHALDLGR